MEGAVSATRGICSEVARRLTMSLWESLWDVLMKHPERIEPQLAANLTCKKLPPDDCQRFLIHLAKIGSRVKVAPSIFDPNYMKTAVEAEKARLKGYSFLWLKSGQKLLGDIIDDLSSLRTSAFSPPREAQYLKVTMTDDLAKQEELKDYASLVVPGVFMVFETTEEKDYFLFINSEEIKTRKFNNIELNAVD